MGQGYGHLVRYLNLIRRLVERGDEVSFLAKDAARARSVFHGLPVHIEQIESGFTPPEKSLRHLNAYPEILHNFGFFEPAALVRQLQPWLGRMAALAPDILIVDHSPSALLANRVRAIPVIHAGNGFTIPPRSTPMRAMRYWDLRRREQLAANENHVLEVCNEVLSGFGAAPMAVMSELLDVDCEWLMSFAELDHYGRRDGARYLGSLPAKDFGIAPQWLDQPGPRLFAYLSGGSLVEGFVEAVADVGANLCLYAPNLEAEALRKLTPLKFHRVDAPVDLRLAGAQCQAAVTQGTLNTVSAFLVTGRPQLALPNNLERYMVARRLEVIGGGLMAPVVNPGDVSAKLHAVLSDRAYSRAAGRFAERYREADPADQVAALLADIDRLLRRHAMGSNG